MSSTLPHADPSYGVTVRLPGVSLEEGRRRLVAALGAEGFGVLTEIDVQATLKKKLDADFRPYVILGACNPSLARRALELDLGIGLLLPCNVCLWQDGDAAVVSIVRPEAMLEVAGPAAAEIATEAGVRLGRVADALRSGAS